MSNFDKDCAGICGDKNQQHRVYRTVIQMASHLTLFYMKKTYSFQYDETVILHCRYKKYNKTKMPHCTAQ